MLKDSDMTNFLIKDYSWYFHEVVSFMEHYVTDVLTECFIVQIITQRNTA